MRINLYFAIAIVLGMGALSLYFADHDFKLHPAPGVPVQAHSSKDDKSLSTGIPNDDDYQALLRRNLVLPIRGLRARDIKDTFREERAGGKPHEATDILAERGTPVRAMGDGTIRKLFLSKPGGLTIYVFDPEGVFCYYYAHLDHYADDLKEGMPVSRGDVIGFVGTTGNALDGPPHLHLAIMKLGPEKSWWQGKAIDPYPVLMHLTQSRMGPLGLLSGMIILPTAARSPGQF